MISAYAIGTKVWLCGTAKVADPEVPTTLPVGSLVLTTDQAKDLRHQLILAIAEVDRRAA